MRAATSFVVIASVLLGLATSPFHHTHSDDPDHSHAQGIGHAHFDHHDDDHDDDDHDLEAAESDSSAVYADWFVGTSVASILFTADLPATISIPLPTAAPAVAVELQPRAHDPPWRTLLAPRAPPV